MSLEATHIRFALDIKDNFDITDIGQYILGAIYPDSRYVTGIDRKLTHGDYILKPEFASDDFKKGWQAHEIGDIIFRIKQYEILPELNIHPDNKDIDLWVKSSSIKVIQDMDDMKRFDLQKYLPYLEQAYNPNGENISIMKKYNKIFIDLYKDKKSISVEDSYKMWLAFGVEKEHALKIKTQTEEYLVNKNLVKKIATIYDEMLKDYKKVLK